MFLFCALGIAAAQGTAADLRGFVSEGAAGVLQYQFCNGPSLSRELYPIVDNTPNGSLAEGVRAVRQIMLHRYRPLYVEVRGERTKKGAIAYQFQRAIGFVESCATMPRDIAPHVRLLAVGEEPQWRLSVTDNAGALELPEKVSMRLPAAAFKAVGTDQSAKRMVAQVYGMQSADEKSVSIEVNPQMCTDGRSETAYGARVTVRLEKRLLSGCAARF